MCNFVKYTIKLILKFSEKSLFLRLINITIIKILKIECFSLICLLCLLCINIYSFIDHKGIKLYLCNKTHFQ